MMVAFFNKNMDPFKLGMSFTSKKILQFAIVLLGFGMNLTDILSKGNQSLPIILTTISTSLLIAFILSKILQIPENESTLVGVGSSICGASAIAATAPILGASDEEIAQSISVVFLFNVFAVLVFPFLGHAFGLSDQGFATFAGTAINDTSAVTAAATAWDEMHGSNILGDATVVKLTRTLAIIPLTLGLAFIRLKRNQTADFNVSMKKIFPVFILFFLFSATMTTLFNLSPKTTDPLLAISKFLIVMAMSAIGLNTNIVKLLKTGGKPILMGFCCWIGIASVCLGMQYVLECW